MPTGITKAQGGPSHDIVDECDLTIKSTGILKEEEINTVIKKFKEDTLHAYDEAIQAHKNKTREQMPLWMWGLLIYFSMDNIGGYLFHPLIFYPVLIFGTMFVVLFKMGMLGLVLPSNVVQIITPYLEKVKLQS